MASPIFHHLIVPYLVAMFLAINMGGSGTAPAFAAAFGAGVIRRNVIPGLFGIMVFLGAILAGKLTATTMGSEIIDPDRMNFEVTTIVLMSIALALLFANLLGVPQSTSQATVFSITAAALYYNELNTDKLFYEILPTWFILPVISFFTCLLIGKYIYNPLRKKGVFLSAAVRESPLIRVLIIASSLYVAFAIGSNNVANAAGPIAVMSINELHLDFTESNFLVIIIMTTLLIAPNFGIGSSIFGYKLVRIVGQDIIMLGKIEAVIIALVSASLLLVASVFKGIPSSLVQVNVTAILGIAVAKLGARNILKKTNVSRFFVVWLVSPAIAFLLTLIGLALFAG